MNYKRKLYLFFLLFISLFFTSCDFFFNGLDKLITYNTPDPVTVYKTYEKKQECDWLIIMYVDGDNNLQNSLYEDINEVEEALYNYNLIKEQFSLPNVKVIALWDGLSNYSNNLGSGNTQILEIGPDSSHDKRVLCSETKDLTQTVYYDNDSYFYEINNWTNFNYDTEKAEANMGDPKTLAGFLEWVDVYYKPKHKILQFSNHGAGPRSVLPINRALCSDDTSSESSTALLYTKDVSDALEKAGYGEDNKLDMLIFDVCLGASIEDAYQYRNYADYMLASANEVPGYGLDYTKLFYKFSNTCTAEDIGKSIIDSYVEFYTNQPNYIFTDWNKEKENYGSMEKAKYFSRKANTLSLIDLSKIDNVADKISKLADLISKSDNLTFRYGVDGVAENETTVRDYFKNNLLDTRIVTLRYSIAGKTEQEYNLVYPGTYTWLYDIGFIARNIALFTHNEEKAQDLYQATNNLTSALQDALVYTWREGPSKDQNDGEYATIDGSEKDNSLYYGGNLPFGLTISGATRQDLYGTYVPAYPNYYKTDLDFGKDTTWGNLLEIYFANIN